jgi:hypothetical protein
VVGVNDLSLVEQVRFAACMTHTWPTRSNAA